ncbi:MAG: MFS transporter, partial [Hyphomicrobium sp.]
VGFWLFFSVALFGVATIGFGLSTSFLLSLALLVILGGADMISVYVRIHLAQMQTPDAMRGRVASVNMLFITASNELGEFESGVTAAWFGAVGATVLGGVLTLVVVALCAWRIPALRRIDRLEDVALEHVSQ